MTNNIISLGCILKPVWLLKIKEYLIKIHLFFISCAGALFCARTPVLFCPLVARLGYLRQFQKAVVL